MKIRRSLAKVIGLAVFASLLQAAGGSAPVNADSFGSAVFRGDAMLIGTGMPAPRTSDFTYEFYFKMDSLPSVAGTTTVGGGIWLFTSKPNRYAAGRAGVTLFINTNGTLQLDAIDNASPTARSINSILSANDAAGKVVINTWYHIAITRSANTFTIWKNGISVATGSAISGLSGATGDYDSTDLGLGEYLPGNITNFRYTSGSALYTSAFTPPITKLTANGTSQVLIPLENNYSSLTSYSTYSPTLAQPSAVETGKSAYYGGQGYQDATGNLNAGSYLTNNGITYSAGNPFVKITPTFSWSNVSKNLGDASFALTAPSPSTPGTFTYTSANTSVILLSGTRSETATASGAGTSLITATFTPTNTADYNSATVTMTATVIGNTQTISFTPISGMTSGDSKFLLATASSGLSTSYASNTPGICTVSGDKVTATSGGTCSLTASQAGNATYASASATITFTVTSTAKNNDEQDALVLALAGVAVGVASMMADVTTIATSMKSCYRGKTTKKILKNKSCPKGYSTKKPKVSGS